MAVTMTAGSTASCVAVVAIACGALLKLTPFTWCSYRDDEPSVGITYNLQCFEDVLPYENSTRLFPELFVTRTVTPSVENPAFQVFINYFPFSSENQPTNDVVCTSRESAHQIGTKYIHCPLLLPRQRDMKVDWSFYRAPHIAAKFDDEENPSVQPNALRQLAVYLYLGSLEDSDEGTYNCTARRGSQVWKETWQISKRHNWTLSWSGASGDHKAYKIDPATGEITVLPFAKETWLEEKLHEIGRAYE